MGAARHSGCRWGVITVVVGLCLSAAAYEYDSPVYALAQRVEAAARDAHADATSHNHVLLLEDGYEALLLRVHLIRHARRSIDIQTTILANDECGHLIVSELFDAARRGVVVRLMVDYFMSARDSRWIAALTEAHPNLELKYYRPPAKHAAPPRVLELASVLVRFKGTNQRLHNKLMLFDGLIGIVGGRNIDNHYYNYSTSYNFLDRDSVVLGPATKAMAESFEDYWFYRRTVESRKLTDVAAVIRTGEYQRILRSEDFGVEDFRARMTDGLDAAFIRDRFVTPFQQARRLEYISDAPGKNQGKWLWGGGRAARRIRETIRKTDDELLIQSPYLILNLSGRRAFRKLQRQEPPAKVIISTNSFASTDNMMAYSANYKMRSLYFERLGFHIFELKPQPDDFLQLLPNFPELKERAEQDGETREPFVSVHAKSIVVDGRIAYVGSYNLDPRSQNLNTENGVLIEDAKIAQTVREAILSSTQPGRSWVIAKRRFPLSDVNYLIEGLSGLSPVDLWPLRNTTSYELRPGMEPVDPGDEDFYARYDDVGSFPGAEGVSTKQIVTRIYKMLGSLAVPIL
jgi:phosphatidylserine/phosphatidylglycerophosphate/cardiolipin synthase-like enzyme